MNATYTSTLAFTAFLAALTLGYLAHRAACRNIDRHVEAALSTDDPVFNPTAARRAEYGAMSCYDAAAAVGGDALVVEIEAWLAERSER
jgi:hypothetical protein